ncbi:MAG: ARMT1-like domain-containing protein [Methanobrevibacter sp.]|jgi:uncharacterized protein with ATP-grasp and redox domains|nr:ARMT1-like domain-containing protein [Candidatus Methanoflexus mossambicus]
MKIYYDCGACFLRQSKEAIDLATNDSDLKLEIIEEILKYLAINFKKGASSNKIGTDIHRIIKNRTGNNDPYIKQKKLGNKIAIDILPKFQSILKNNNDLKSFIKSAILGNILDFGALGLTSDLEKLINNGINKELGIDDIEEFKKTLKKHDKVLYLADNTGEIIFDKLLIEYLIKHYNLKIIYAVKENPILNDACLEDGRMIGLDKITELITTGTDSIGIVYEYLSPEFRKIFNESEFIISKGLGNYEGLTEIMDKEIINKEIIDKQIKQKDIYCLLCAKCSAIAKDLNVKYHDMVLKKL